MAVLELLISVNCSSNAFLFPTTQVPLGPPYPRLSQLPCGLRVVLLTGGVVCAQFSVGSACEFLPSFPQPKKKKRGKQTTANPNSFYPVLKLSSTSSAPVTSGCVISRVLWGQSDFDASNWQKHIKGDLSNSSPKSKQIRIRLLKNRCRVTETELIQ